MRFKILLIIALSYLVSIGLYAQTNENRFRLEVTAKQYKEHMLYFANYWQGNTYKLDSCLLDSRGQGIVELDATKVPAGQYLLYIEPDLRIEMLIDKEQKNIKAVIPKDLSKSTITGSPDTEGYWRYLNSVKKLNEKIEKLNEDINNAKSEIAKAKFQAEIDALQSEIDKATWNVINNNKGSWLSSYLKGTIGLQLPEELMLPTVKRSDVLKYVQTHYFDNLDMTDVRLQRTSYFYDLVNSYLDNWVEPDWDSTVSAYSNLVARTKPEKEAFEPFLSAMLNKSLSSPIMGMENVWARLAEDYIFHKEIDIDSTALMQLKTKYENIKLNRIGMTAQDMTMITIDGDTLNLFDVEAEYIILEFFSPTCGYCREDMTYLAKEFYLNYKEKGVRIVAFNLGESADVWKDFVKECGMREFINCNDPIYKSEYWMKYDTSRVPMSYVLDKNKKIVGKGISRDNLEKLIKQLIKGNGNN